MAASGTDDLSGGRSLEGLSSCQSRDGGDGDAYALAEWRSSDQVENGVPSTSPPYWDSDDSDDDYDGGPKPVDLYGKYTWKIEKFSQINKRELRSNAFEVGGYKWYILIYPQGCDVCNHLSLFLCVANHDKLLPGWSHFAQFTIAVVNKDPKKSKYSDTLHRFWKKEHDWGWKKFMELSKVSDGFVDADTLIIKAQVQVIREKADRPFRCLDCQYRRELVRVYLTNVEQICRRFVEERRGKLGKMIEDKARWSSFCAFWLGMDQNTKRRMSREKKDMILKVVVKHFFIEKEVTSTLVMDSLHSGLKALEGQSKGKKGKSKLLEGEDTPAPIVRVEKDMFVLVDDVLLLLERAAVEPLPPKDDKGPQNRTKDGGSGEEFSKDSIERDERRLTELGRRTVEIFVLAHIFSNKIEVAYQEAVALKRQEELIREEEAAWLAENEKAKRGASEKDKKTKKKQGKQKRNNRKGKDKLKEDKPAVVIAQDKQLHEDLSAGMQSVGESETLADKDDTLQYVSDVSDTVECSVDMLRPDSEDRDASPVNWDTDASEIHPPAEASGSEISCVSTVQNGVADKRSSSIMDDSSSTCSTDSAPSFIINGSYRTNSFTNYKNQKSPSRGKSQQSKGTSEDCSGGNEVYTRSSEPSDASIRNDVPLSSKAVEFNDSEGAITSLQDRTKWPELNAVKKEDDTIPSQRKLSKKDKDQGHQGDVILSQEKVTVASPSSKNPSRIVISAPAVQPNPNVKSTPTDLALTKKISPSNGQHQIDKPTPNMSSYIATASKPDSTKATVVKVTEKLTSQQASGLSRPSSAPLRPGNLAAAPVVSMVQATASITPLLSRSSSAAGCLGGDPVQAAAAHPYVPQSYRNAIVGNSFSASSSAYTHSSQPVSAVVNSSSAFSQQSTLLQNPSFLSPASERMEARSVSSCMSFTATQDEALGHQPWMESPQRDVDRRLIYDSQSMLNDIPNFDMYRPMSSGPHQFFPSELSAGTSGRQVQSALADEFPHLDIINDLLDDEVSGRTTHGNQNFLGPGRGSTLFNRQLSYPTDISHLSEGGSLGSSCRFDRSRSYPDDGFQTDYGVGSPFDSMGEFAPQGNPMPYMNGQYDSLVSSNQWQLLGPDLSLLSMRSSGMDNYSYSLPEYPNMACDVNGYTMFRPSNGH